MTSLGLREGLRARYIEAWNNMDAEELLATTAPEFHFDDPADPAPIPRQGLVAYMPVWPDRAAALGGRFEFDITDKVVAQRDDYLLEWYWWILAGTSVEGAAQIKTGDHGVLCERLAYFNSPWPLLR